MFPEYRELITQLKHADLHFTRLFDRHNELDKKIKNIDAQIELATQEETESLKKEKLHLKDEIYQLLQQTSKA
jgi:uncharacterized protein YdcH (DUF465 family)